MMIQKKYRSEQGFTIVELMIATMVFSLVLLLCAFAIIHVGRLYYKGMITNRTQDTTRRITDDTASALQFGAGNADRFHQASAPSSDSGYIGVHCLGDVRYTYILNVPLGQDHPHVLWRDNLMGGACEPANLTDAEPSSGQDGQEMLGENMRLTEFSISGFEQVWSVAVRVSYGETDDLFERNGAGDTDYGICRGVNAGGQFCAVSRLETTVMRRVRS